MRVLLINPSWDRYVSHKGRRINRAWPPLDLLNCAALLEQIGVRVEILDARCRWVDPEEIARRALGFDKVFVTSSPLDRWQCPNLELDLFWERMKPLRHSQLHILGVHGTHYPDVMLQKTAAQVVVRGEPEWTVRDLCSGKPLSEIAGITYRDGAVIRATPDRPLEDLKQWPSPAYHLLDLNDYQYELVGERFVLLETTRGCPFPCTFCMRDMYGGRAYRQKTPEHVERDVAMAVEQNGAESGYFIDLEFSLNKKYSMEVCRRIEKFSSKWTWCCQTRADSVDPELLGAMKRAGCSLIHFGVETGSDRVLQAIDKKISFEQIQRGVAEAKAAGIQVACFFMLGFPGETDAEREQTLDFAERLNPTYASFHTVSPYPGTPLHKAKPWDHLYPESVAEGDEQRKLRRWEREAYRRYYLRFGFLMSFLREFNFQRASRQAKLFLDLA